MNDETPQTPPNPEENKAKHEPMFNVPPLTLGVTVLVLAVHMIRLFSPSADEFLVTYLTFIPDLFSAAPLENSYRILGYTLLHFGWLHLGMNVGGLLAFGSGVEKILGSRAWLLILIGGSIAGVMAHWALFPHSLNPMGGISAGLSALFGALMPLMARSKKSLIRLIIIFILINVAFGLIGMPDQPDASIAWQAHLGGFVFGLVAGLFLLRKKQNPPV